MGLVGWVALGAGLVLALLVAEAIYLAIVLRWEDERTRGLAYYGLPPAARERFKRALRRHAMLLYPILRLSGKLSRFSFARVSFRHRGVAAPLGSCSPESFARAESYQARPDDVFVVTQMKCGTTWMQHLTYEVLHRGNGSLVESGTALYAVSPWLEGVKSVPMERARLLGSERPSRVIKTHLPAQLCPWSAQARYIYVVRHPVSCFASCADFIATNVGALAPPLPVVEEWFRSPEQMWWGTWTDHVKGWWDLAQRERNVLFLSFEEMKRDLPGVVRRVAEFLGLAPLGDAEVARVVEKCSFAYMQRHQGAFEMNPPHILQVDADLFVKGSADRHRDVPEEVRRRIASWCVKEAAASGFQLARLYPELGAGA
jgi:aryl sulfotransferase